MPTSTLPQSRTFCRSRRFVCCAVWSAIAWLIFPGLLAQTAATPSANEATHLLRGQVVNALDGSPVPRALVTVNSRSALTDYQGRFEFAGFAGTDAFASVRKPGFSANLDTPATNATQRLTDLDAPVLMKLYPDALVSGTLTSRDGAPLSHVQVRLLRTQYDGVALRSTAAGDAQTNARGEYRISAPAGRFRLVSSFVQKSFETGEAVLPASFPEPLQSSASTLIELRSGAERHIDLRAKVGAVYPVALRLEPASSPRMNPRITVSTSAGDEFYASLSSDQHLNLPTGTYTVKVQADDRDGFMSGLATVTVTSHDTPALLVHLAPDPQFVVELLPGDLAPSSANSNLNNASSLQEVPNPQQFNLSFHNQLATGQGQEQDVRLHQAADKSSSFRVSPGRYRLIASGGGQWHLQSATLGDIDLLRNDLVVGPGSAGGTLRILVSNQTGTVHARTNLPQGSSAWLYLLPRGPILIPIHPTPLTSDSTGALVAIASVPPGTYTALLVGTRLETDPGDPAFLASFVSGPKDVEVQPNADTAFSLDLAKSKEAEQ